MNEQKLNDRCVTNLINASSIVAVVASANPNGMKVHIFAALQASLHKDTVNIEGGLEENQDRHILKAINYPIADVNDRNMRP